MKRFKRLSCIHQPGHLKLISHLEINKLQIRKCQFSFEEEARTVLLEGTAGNDADGDDINGP